MWSVRAKAIKNILDNAITLDDPSSPPLVVESMPKLSETTKKKKRMPKVSPVKHFAYKQKENKKEKEKGSPQKPRGPKITFVSNTKGGEKRKQETLQKEIEHEARLRKEEEKVDTKTKDV